MVKYYKTSGGYFYKKLNNGDIKRISSKVYNNNVIKGGAGGGGGGASKNNLKSRHFELYIAINGYKSIIKAILKMRGYGKYFNDEHIITNKESDVPSKNNQLKLILKDKPPNTVLLIDDSHENIDAARKLKYHTYWVNNRDSTDLGIQPKDARLIGKLLRKHSKIDTIVFGGHLTFFSYDFTNIFTNLYENSYKEISTKTKAMINNAQKIFSNMIRRSPYKGVANGVESLFDILGINPIDEDNNSITSVNGNNNNNYNNRSSISTFSYNNSNSNKGLPTIPEETNNNLLNK